MTKGKKHIAPCTLNEWPLNRGDFNEFETNKIIKETFKARLGGGRKLLKDSIMGDGNPTKGSTTSLLILIASIILLFVFIVMIIRCAKFTNNKELLTATNL